MSNTTTKTLEVTLENGKGVSCDVEICWYTDHNYGADADGNRGMSATFLDDIKFTTPKVDIDGDELTQQERNEAEKLLIQAAENIDLSDDVGEDDYDWHQEMEDDEERHYHDEREGRDYDF